VMEPVIENLLENAASFTPAGGRIEISLHAEGDRACLRVLDEGPGVNPRHLPHIFERAASFRDEPVGDTIAERAPNLGHQGLGLWIVQRNVEGLGGTVGARNRTRGGFEVFVYLPGDD
jgi:signal transduction histidine kinase